mmetsp:Transcript_13637/g.33369  ORF Transcript_13637/g.33369 Transcript_13637/m.33369 type:complete len:97 (-) Transcript_13637:229-519(-)
MLSSFYSSGKEYHLVSNFEGTYDASNGSFFQIDTANRVFFHHKEANAVGEVVDLGAGKFRITWGGITQAGTVFAEGLRIGKTMYKRRQSNVFKYSF